MRYWADGPPEDADNRAWWREEREEEVATHVTTVHVRLDLNRQHTADMQHAFLLSKNNFVQKTSNMT